MLCVYCNSDIENDSFHCDQCGKELLICPTCNRPGKGKNCVHDGGKLFSPKQKSITDKSQSINPSVAATALQNNPHQSNLPHPVNSNIQTPTLKISNAQLKIDIEIKNGDIIGRTEGNYNSLFNQFPQISGKHVEFNFDNVNGWQIKDFGSTNGSAVSDNPNWQTTPKLKQNIPVQLKNNSFLLIANIEFQVKIILPQTSTGTQRL
jgi:pSer/pThr/pTyr-binding forkhead associated (FHA) protein